MPGRVWTDSLGRKRNDLMAAKVRFQLLSCGSPVDCQGQIEQRIFKMTDHFDTCQAGSVHGI